MNGETSATAPAELAREYGTPLYVYDLDRVRTARRDLRAALPEEFELYFALKANPHPQIVEALHSGPGHSGPGHSGPGHSGPDKGCRAEISSTGELAAAVAAGVAGEEILYTGPGKTPDEIAEAIKQGVRTFSAESPGDMAHIGEVATSLGVVADCLLRINSVSASATTSIRMTGTPSQFGIDSETLPEVLPQLRAVPGARIAGLHLFPLSNARDEDALIGEFRHTIELAARLSRELDIPLELLDIGGGFTVPYAVPGPRPLYPRLRAALAESLDQHLPGWRDGAPRVACESGRYLVGDAGTLVCRVANLKTSRGRGFVVTDAGINTFGGMSGLGRLLPVSVEPVDGAPTRRASLVGPLCTPGDVLGREIDLPAYEVGDLVTVPNAGAYGPTASLLMFLGRPAPVEVVCSGDEVVSVSRIEHRRAYERGSGPCVTQ